MKLCFEEQPGTYDAKLRAHPLQLAHPHRFLPRRINNPTLGMLEAKVAALEGGAMGVVTASGMSAQLLALTTICKSGDTIVSSPSLYGGTANQFKVLFPRFGIKVKFTEGVSAADFAK